MKSKATLIAFVVLNLFGCWPGVAFASSCDYRDPVQTVAYWKAEPESMAIPFESGNISSKTGQKTNANNNPARSVDYIRLNSFIDASIEKPYYVRFFAYDKDYTFLRTCRGVQEIDQEMIMEAAPGCTYIRLLLSNKRGTAMDPENLEQYGFTFHGKISAEPAKKTMLSLHDLEPYTENGVYRQTFSVYLDESENNCSQIISCDAKYLTDSGEIPTIQLRLVNKNDTTLYYSPQYRIGGQEAFETKEWRAPPFQGEFNRLKITVTIPEGDTLYIQDISNQEDADIQQDNGNIIYHAHMGFSGLCSQSTVYAFEMAGKMGYQSCVAIPKFTEDGVCVCFHDDDSIRRKLRYADGRRIPEGSEDDRPISGFTYDELMEFDAGLRKNRLYAGAKVPTMAEFFEICVRYDMAPVLSVHSNSGFRDAEGKANFSVIRDAAERYGILDKLRIKSGNAAVQSAARSIFGKDIGGYILLQGQNSVWDPLNVAKKCGFVASDAVSAAESDYSVVMEYFYAAATDEKILLAEREGFPVSIATTGTGISGPEQERLIGLGVTEFTIDHHCSMGLNW